MLNRYKVYYNIVLYVRMLQIIKLQNYLYHSQSRNYILIIETVLFILSVGWFIRHEHCNVVSAVVVRPRVILYVRLR